MITNSDNIENTNNTNNTNNTENIENINNSIRHNSESSMFQAKMEIELPPLPTTNSEIFPPCETNLQRMESFSKCSLRGAEIPIPQTRGSMPQLPAYRVNYKNEYKTLQRDLDPHRSDFRRNRVICCCPKQGRFTKLIRRSLNLVHLTPEQKSIMIDRYVEMIENYTRDMNMYCTLHKLFHLIVQTGSLLIPALLTIEQFVTECEQMSSIFWSTWSVALLVGLIANYLKLYKIDKKHYHSKETYENLVTEGWEYLSLTGKYDTDPLLHETEMDVTHQTRFKQFCKQIEKIRRNEKNQTTLPLDNQGSDEVPSYLLQVMQGHHADNERDSEDNYTGHQIV